MDKRQRWRGRPGFPAFPRGSRQIVPAGWCWHHMHCLPDAVCYRALSDVRLVPLCQPHQHIYPPPPHAQPSPSLPTSTMTHAYADPLHQPNNPTTILPARPPPLLCVQTCDTPTSPSIQPLACFTWTPDQPGSLSCLSGCFQSHCEDGQAGRAGKSLRKKKKKQQTPDDKG